MFKFNFEVEEDEEDQVPLPGTGVQGISDTSANVPAPPSTSAGSLSHQLSAEQRCHHLSLDELIDTLPETISYSPIHLPFLTHPLLRRDLYDARFQLAATTTTTTASSAGPSSLPQMSSAAGSHSGAAALGEASDPDSADTVKYGSASSGEGEEFVDAKTDLIPGHYEGGLKTWEGGVDLVEVLAGVQGGVGEWVRGSKVLEVGCGTAIPSAYILRSVLSSPSSQLSSAHTHPDLSSPAGSTDPATHPNTHSESLHSSDLSYTQTRTRTRTTLHLQDFNLPVLSLVTLPNLLLASLPLFPPEAFHNPDDADDVESILPDLDIPGEIYVSDRVKGAWRELLEQRGVTLRFTYGHWGGLARDLQGGEGQLRSAKEGIAGGEGEGVGQGGMGEYGLVMTAETIYAEESVTDLIGVLRSATARSGGGSSGETRTLKREEVALEDSLGDLSVGDEWAWTPLRDGEPVILVAAKVLYFGVGGGLQSFLDRVSANGGWWSGVKEWTMGVGRKVVRLGCVRAAIDLPACPVLYLNPARQILLGPSLQLILDCTPLRGRGLPTPTGSEATIAASTLRTDDESQEGGPLTKAVFSRRRSFDREPKDLLFGYEYSGDLNRDEARVLVS
ncbi:hypothetical protein EHS25_004104 [Saitozyma podzolica]|uniref:Histidine protein methyltransferase 1 n=1 Tax=Saitozyma podzolica TaxID=1890683 RepID=A0A427YTH2_9TREE|nr:hypothetical protein EHS25_004104 [Saitozyma podzolica]